MSNAPNLGVCVLMPLSLLFATTACSKDAQPAGAAAAASAASAPVSATAAAAPAAGAHGLTAAAAVSADGGSDGSVQAMLQSQDAQIIAASGSMHAVAEACGASTAAELASLKEKSRAMMAERGVDPATYDASFSAAYAEAKRKISAASPQQKARSCAQVEQLQKMAAGA